MKQLIFIIPLVAILACSQNDQNTSNFEKGQIDVTFENYNQAETARNFNNWVKMGSDNKMVHRKELSPIGPDAPTIRMNLDTLYSIGIYDNDGDMTVTLPVSDIYQSVMIVDTDGYTPFFAAEPGTFPVKHDSEYCFIAVRTVVKDRHSKESFEEAYKAQAGLKVEGNGTKSYVMPNYNQEQLHALTLEYNTKFEESGISFTYGDGKTPVNEEHRTWSNATGWGGMVTEVGKSNTYVSSENLPGDKPLAVTFPDPGNKFFTSFTIYDVNGYLMEGNTHINNYTWKPNTDGSITIHFNAEGKPNNITSGGKEFNYTVRNYGASQDVIVKKINPVKPEPAWAQPPKMKMTTAVPEGVATPDKLDTRLGTLNLFDGVPDEATTRKVYNNLDFQRGVQAYLNSLQVASLSGMRASYLEFGPANTTALLFEQLMDSKALWLTPNTVSIYMACWLELKDEPMVLQTPPNVLGFIDDAWFNYICDFGNAGPDKGKGGTFIVAPPGYSDEDFAKLKSSNKNAHVFRSACYGHWVIWRGSQVDGDTGPAIASTKKIFSIAPLSQRDNPPKMNFVNVSGKYHNTIHRMDYELFEEVNEVIQREPTAAGDPELLGQLAAIGIQKGKPFAPDARMKKILTEAADIGAVTVRAMASRPRGDSWLFYPGKRQWNTPFVAGHEFLENGSRVLDARSYLFFYGTGITPAMTAKMVGKGSQYAVTYTDSKGDQLLGSKTYKVNLPAPVPIKNFWSFTLYDNQTRSMLQTDQRFPGIDSKKKGLQTNADGSCDIYVGPTAPKGKESNWIQSVPGKGWNTVLRLYGPLEPWFDKTWVPGDFELVDGE